MGQVKKIPMRKCVGCQEMKEKKQLIRVIRTDSGDVLIDETGRKNGRGAYLCRNSACMEKALKTKGLERSLKTGIPEEICTALREEMKLLERTV